MIQRGEMDIPTVRCDIALPNVPAISNCIWFLISQFLQLRERACRIAAFTAALMARKASTIFDGVHIAARASHRSARRGGKFQSQPKKKRSFA